MGYGVLLIFLLLGLASILREFSGNFFTGEILAIVVLGILAFAGLSGYRRSWGELVLLLAFFLYLANLLLVWYLAGRWYVVLTILAVLGFVLATFPPREERSGERPEERYGEKHGERRVEKLSGEKFSKKLGQREDSGDQLPDEVSHSIVLDDGKSAAKYASASAAKAASARTARLSGAVHVPGKYVASISSTYYHEPKCEWAKKIMKSRQVWFNDKKEAWEKGLKKHDCVG